VSLDKKVIVITGCSSGIGYETALMFARNGFITYATMRNPEKGYGIRSIVEKENFSIKIIKLDVEQDKSVKDAITTMFLESLITIWLLLTNLDNALEVFLKKRLSKYGFKAYAISFSFVLFLLIIYHK